MKKETHLTHAGRAPHEQHGAVNPPVYRVSTVVFPTVESLKAAGGTRFDSVYYGRFGTPTTMALEQAMAGLEGAARCIATSSGLAAITGALCAFLKAGDHLLMTDTAYWPTRKFCDTALRAFGVKTTYYDPLIGAEIKDLIRPETRVVFCESPGSHTFEIQDVPAIFSTAREAGCICMIDNTWATPLYFPAFTHGADVSIHAGTKYVSGHSDAMLGLINLRDDALFRQVKETVVTFGHSVGSEEAFLGLRGLRTLAVRLKRHQETGIGLAEWLRRRPEVARVLHPTLPDDPGHALWRRDFSGASGLFGVILKPAPDAAVAAMLDGLRHFAMGYSWGGYESLILPTTGSVTRTATVWDPEGPSVRIHAGLEDPEDLMTDLEAGFARLRAAS